MSDPIQSLKTMIQCKDFSYLLKTVLCMSFFITCYQETIENNAETTRKVTLNKTADETNEWTEWSAWSICSRSCDGGVTLQIRKCVRKGGCVGESVRHRICNMQPCMEQSDFRVTQCAAYNNKPYRRILYTWKPYYDPEDPCSLTCQAENYNFVAKLAPRVRDGTRCRDGSLDMCVAGKCMTVGCDLQLGSTKKVDDCGVCGGDGSSCRKPTYHWIEAQFSPCSVTCGGGYQMSRPVCLNKETDREMDERLCDVSKRPKPHIRICNTQKCPATWITESWTTCSASCEGGKQTRQVYCAQGSTNGTRNKVSSVHCPHQKPISERLCNTQACPKWFHGPWSGCSVTCGLGHQTRVVFCHDEDWHRTEGCDRMMMPNTKQSCATGITCFGDDGNKADDSDDDTETIRGSQEDAPPSHPFGSLSWSQRFVGPPPDSTEPTYVVGDWGPCSVTCDKGIRKRTVDCKITLEFSRTTVTIPDKECTGPRPPEIENCYARPCALDQNKQEDNDILRGQVGIEVTYSWRSAGFTPCSASCLGGTRESIIQCVRDHDQAVVNYYHCDIRKKLDSITQTCNDFACPPRWNVSEYTPCSKICGGGIQRREVQCVHEVTRGSTNTLIVPNNHCPQPPPRSERYCNVYECPSRWKVEPWSKCSRSCGGGVKTRKIRCQKELTFGPVHEQSPSSCPKRRPIVQKKCNTKPCPGDLTQPIIYASSQQTYEQKHPQNRVFLKVGGKALVFSGTNLKIRCPSERINKSLIVWYKNNKKIQSSRKLKISRKGALRIRKITVQDSGIYSCVAGASKADIKVTVKHFGGGRSEEDKTVERPVMSQESPNIMASGGTVEEDDYSHEHHRTKQEKEDKNRSHFDNHGKIRIFKYPEIKSNNDATTPTHLNTEQHRPEKSKPTKVKQETTNPYIDQPQDIPMSSETSDPKTYDTWENKHGDDLISDQQSGELNADNIYETTEETELTSASSGASSNHALPHIQQLLLNLHQNTFGTSRHTPGEFDDDSLAESMPQSFVLGKGTADNLEFDWIVTNWSKCSQSCGSTGFQVRASQCLVRLNNVTKSVDSSLCIDAGLQSPIIMQKCGLGECPHWETGPWSECSESSCFTWNLAHQKREVTCRLGNGTDLDGDNCDEKTRPRRRRECYNNQCRGTWTVGEWSECTATCGNQGFQTRILQCVWFGTRRPAGNSCRDLPRPIVLRPCKKASCPKSEGCTNHSKYCSLAKTLQMCRLTYYRNQCCLMCRER